MTTEAQEWMSVFHAAAKILGPNHPAIMNGRPEGQEDTDQPRLPDGDPIEPSPEEES